MAKKPAPKKREEDNVHIEVESWQWEEKSPRITWKHWLILSLLVAVGLLFAFGFLVVAGVVLIIGIVVNLVYFIFRKLT